MMKKLLSLIKVDLNTSYGFSAIKYRFKTKKNRWQSIVFALAILSILPTYIILIRGLNGIFKTYASMGQESMFLLTGFLASQFIIFFFGILYVMSKYYFSSDLNHLLVLPIKPSSIFASKFVGLMVSEYLTSLPIILPFIYIYGLKSGQNLLYFLYSIILVLTLPIIPLVLSSLLVMIFMNYTNIGKRKDLLRVIGGLIFIVGLLYVQLKLQSFISKSILAENFLNQIILDSNALVKKAGLIFPPSLWATLALSKSNSLSGFFYLLGFIVVGILGFIIIMVLSEKIFFPGLIGNIEVSASKGENGKRVNLSKIIVKRKAYISLARKELTMIFKTPVYLLNSIGGVIILPILLPMIFRGDEGLSQISKIIEINQDIIALGGIGFIMSLGTLNSIGSTTFSREGKSFWIQRVMPIKARDQIIGRVLSSLAVQVLGVIALTISLIFIFEIEMKTIIIITILGLLASIPMTQIGMLIDILRPYLTWDNPQRAMKQNLNVLISMAIGILYIGGIAYLTFISINRISINTIFFSLSIIFILSSFILFKLLENLIVKQFRELE